jgi:hypothetical protein
MERSNKIHDIKKCSNTLCDGLTTIGKELIPDEINYGSLCNTCRMSLLLTNEHIKKVICFQCKALYILYLQEPFKEKELYCSSCPNCDTINGQKNLTHLFTKSNLN